MKKLIKMGQLMFQVQDIIKQYNIQVFSSIYSLYADMEPTVQGNGFCVLPAC